MNKLYGFYKNLFSHPLAWLMGRFNLSRRQLMLLLGLFTFGLFALEDLLYQHIFWFILTSLLFFFWIPALIHDVAEEDSDVLGLSDRMLVSNKPYAVFFCTIFIGYDVFSALIAPETSVEKLLSVLGFIALLSVHYVPFYKITPKKNTVPNPATVGS